MIIDECCEACSIRNRKIAEMLRSAGTLNDLAATQAEILESNRNAVARGTVRASAYTAARLPWQEPEDFFDICAGHTGIRFGTHIAGEVRAALSFAALHTADHHGGLYSPMSFQGDLIFGFFLKSLGYRGQAVPILSFSQIRLGNASYGRGILCCDKVDGITRIPLFPKKTENTLAAFAPALDIAAIRRAEGVVRREVQDPDIRDIILTILREDYASPEVLSCERYADQVTLLGTRLSRRLFPKDNGPMLLFLEGEELMRRLLALDLANPDSLVCRMLHEPAILEGMNRTPMKEGMPVSSFLFLGRDRKGRGIPLNLGTDHVLRGRGLDGCGIALDAEAEALKQLIENRQIIPTGYLAACALAWARGLTWLGGEFQSVYLPCWQKKTVKLLRASGFPELAAAVEPWDCSGYISSPVFALSPVEGGAAGAGMIEFLKYPPSKERLSGWMDTTLQDAHRMSMFELYHDLIPAGERKENYYERIAREAAARFPENLLS